MILLPAIDLYEGKAVRLYKGDYKQMTVYSENPLQTAEDIEKAGAEYLHVVDLEGAKNGTTPNFDVVSAICKKTKLKVEIGGGIRSFETIEKYLSAGVNRVILGTKALEDEAFLLEAIDRYGAQIAVGVDAKDGKVATHGWLNVSDISMFDFIAHLSEIGAKTVICTDISKDGAMKGTNRLLYKELSRLGEIDIVASGGVSSLEDIVALKEIGINGAILGKAMYIGAVDLKEALEVSK